MNSEMDAGSPDTAMLHRVAERVGHTFVQGGDLAAAVFDARFPMGARVPDPAGAHVIFQVGGPCPRILDT